MSDSVFFFFVDLDIVNKFIFLFTFSKRSARRSLGAPGARSLSLSLSTPLVPPARSLGHTRQMAGPTVKVESEKRKRRVNESFFFADQSEAMLSLSNTLTALSSPRNSRNQNSQASR